MVEYYYKKYSKYLILDNDILEKYARYRLIGKLGYTNKEQIDTTITNKIVSRPIILKLLKDKKLLDLFLTFLK